MKKILFIFTMLLVLNITFAQDSTFESKIASTSLENKTIQCDFEQHKKVKNIKNTIITKGKFYYDNGGKMSLIYNEPKGDKVLIFGENFTIVTAGKKIESSASDNPMMMQICNMLQACMSGDVSKLGRGWQRNIKEDEAQYYVELRTEDRRIKKYIDSLILKFEKTDMTLNEMQTNETSGGFTIYKFTNKVINKQIDSQKFKL